LAICKDTSGSLSLWEISLTHKSGLWTRLKEDMVLRYTTPKVLCDIAWGCLLLATPGHRRRSHLPWVAAEETGQPRAMMRNAFGVGMCPARRFRGKDEIEAKLRGILPASCLW
jgi:hypothetical protein